MITIAYKFHPKNNDNRHPVLNDYCSIKVPSKKGNPILDDNKFHPESDVKKYLMKDESGCIQITSRE